MDDISTPPGSMSAKPASSPNRLAVGLLAMIPLVAVLMATLRGVGMSEDSASYVSAGLNLSSTGRLETFAGDPLTLFPPGLSAVVAGGDIIGLGSGSTLRLVNALSSSLIVLLTGMLLSLHVSQRRLVVCALSFVAVSTSLGETAVMAWSETLFVVLSLAFLLLLERAVSEPTESRWPVFAALVVWCAFMTRYAGIVMAPIGGLALLFGRWDSDRNAALRRASSFILVASMVPVLWMVRNRLVDGTLMGPRRESTNSLPKIAYWYSHTVGEWFATARLPGPVLAVVGAVVATGLAIGAVATVRRNDGPVDAAPVRSLMPLTLFIVGYSLYLVLAQLSTRLDQISNRLLSPVLVPTVIVATSVLGRSVPMAGRRLRVLGSMSVAVVLGVQALGLVELVVHRATNGRGFTEAAWTESPLVRAVSGLPDDALVVSNQPHGLWATTGRQPIVHWWTEIPEDERFELESRIALGLGSPRCGSAYLAWFDLVRGVRVDAPIHNDGGLEFEVVGTFDDGVLYRLDASVATACPATVER